MSINPTPPKHLHKPGEATNYPKQDKEQLFKERMSEPFGDEFYGPGELSPQEEAKNLINIFKKKIPPPNK